MIDVLGNNHLTRRHCSADLLRRELLPLGHIDHFFSDQSFAGKMHLGKITVPSASSLSAPPRNPLFTNFGLDVAVICAHRDTAFIAEPFIINMVAEGDAGRAPCGWCASSGWRRPLLRGRPALQGRSPPAQLYISGIISGASGSGNQESRSI